MTFEWRELNGGVGLLILERGVPYACFHAAGAVADPERLWRLYVVRNPVKLARLAG